MSILQINLLQSRRLVWTFTLPAEAVINTTLLMGSDRISLPTLVSVETLIGHVNRAGYELVGPSQVTCISRLVNSYYLPTPIETWKDQTLDLDVNAISKQNQPIYTEINNAREILLQASRDTSYYGNIGDTHGLQQTREQAKTELIDQMQNKPQWWQKIPNLLATTALSELCKQLIGVPIHTCLHHAGIV